MMHPLSRCTAMILTGLLLLAGGCDDALVLDDEDKRVALGAFPHYVCPEPGGTGESLLIATVYGVDGNVVQDATVHFETTAGTVEPGKASTNRRGLARSTLSVGFTPDLTATAMVSAVGEDTALLYAPAPAFITGVPDRFYPTGLGIYQVGEQVLLTISLAEACHAKTIVFVLGFDPTYLNYVETTVDDAFAFEEGQPVDVEITDVPGFDTIQVTVERDPMGTIDFTGTGGVVYLTFDAIAETLPDTITEFTLTGTTIQDGLGTFYPLEEVTPAGVQIIPAAAF